MEANPGTFERERFDGFRAAGVNRLSLGVQSFDDARLAAIGRVHDADQARQAARRRGEIFPTFNLDLMYALPGQTPAQLASRSRAGARLRAAAPVALPPHPRAEHAVCALSAGAAGRRPGRRDAGRDRGAAARQPDFEHYEVSAYARPGHRARHNLNYWTFGDYLGIGAGAHGKLSFHDRIVRQARYRHPRRYMEAALAGNAVERPSDSCRADLPSSSC